MQSRKLNFLVISPTESAPLMFQRSNLMSGQNWISFYLVMNRPCTIYFGLFPLGTLDIDMGFTIIKNKRVGFDYFAEEYWLGEQIQDVENFNYSIMLTNLTPFKDYYLQVIAFLIYH